MFSSNENLLVKYTDACSWLNKLLYGKFIPRKITQQWGWMNCLETQKCREISWKKYWVEEVRNENIKPMIILIYNSKY